MSFEFTNDGLTIQTYQELYDELAAGYRVIYGPDINLDADSPDGQRIGIEAKARLDLQAFAAQLYNQFDPDFSAGEALNRIIKLAGIARQPAARSVVDLNVTTDRGLVLPAGYSLLDDLDQAWAIEADVALLTGITSVSFSAENFGLIEAAPGTITSPADIVLGVTAVTNPLAAVPGRDEETDAALRVRRNRSLASPATSTTGGLFTAIGDIAGVTDLVVYENDTDTLDAALVLAAHSIWCVVQGGTIADIVEVIAKNKTGGTGIKGGVSGTYSETLYKPDGSEYVIVHEMLFDRPTTQQVYVELTVEGIDSAVVDTVAIENALAAVDFNIAQSLSAAELYSVVYGAGTNFVATLLEISDDDIVYTDGLLVPGPAELFNILVAGITITDIT